MTEKHVVDLRDRHSGCHAPLVRTEDGHVIALPVCLGGLIISGCNDADRCIPLYEEIRDADMQIRDDDRQIVVLIFKSERYPNTVETALAESRETLAPPAAS